MIKIERNQVPRMEDCGLARVTDSGDITIDSGLHRWRYRATQKGDLLLIDYNEIGVSGFATLLRAPG